MRIALVGCGSWGNRLADRIDTMPHCELVSIHDELPIKDERYDPVPSFDVDALIIATPPGERVGIVRDAIAAGVKQIRIEKPLGIDLDEATHIAEITRGKAIVTVGFTLLYDRLYELAFAYMRATAASVERIDAVRVGRRPKHRVDAIVDLGSHVAAIAAFARTENVKLYCSYTDSGSMRSTTFVTNHGPVIVDERTRTVTTPMGEMIETTLDADDPLTLDLRAWIDGTHRGSIDVALQAQRIIDANISERAA